MTVLAAALVVFHFVLFVWYAYNCGYHQGWLDHSDGKINYTPQDFLESLERP